MYPGPRGVAQVQLRKLRERLGDLVWTSQRTWIVNLH